eukprot:scaffold932_cov328-Pavlova_lutheri.AAC.6
MAPSVFGQRIPRQVSTFPSFPVCSTLPPSPSTRPAASLAPRLDHVHALSRVHRTVVLLLPSEKKLPCPGDGWGRPSTVQ